MSATADRFAPEGRARLQATQPWILKRVFWVLFLGGADGGTGSDRRERRGRRSGNGDGEGKYALGSAEEPDAGRGLFT